MDDLAVLPAADERLRCADFARDLRVDPGGTAIRADVLIAAETPLPWPKPVFAHNLLTEVPELVAASDRPTRVLAAVPDEPSGGLHVVAYRRDALSGRVDRAEWRTDESRLGDTISALVAGREPAGGVRLDRPPPTAEVWVCTQGSHDVCCGSDGARFAQDVDGRWNDVVVRRVSHTGGHRFAPTAMTFPDGRMWGYLDPDGLETIVRRSGDPAVLAQRCRGWWGAPAGPEQVAERGVFAAEGWVWETAPRWTEIVGHAGPDRVVTVRVTVGEGGLRRWIAKVGVARDVPTIACRAPGGLPAKPGVEYVLLDLQPE